MKKIIPIALVLLALASCKKDRTCDCTETYTDSGGTTTTTPGITTVIKKSSKRNAKDLCQKTTDVYVASNGKTTTDVMDCKLK